MRRGILVVAIWLLAAAAFAAGTVTTTERVHASYKVVKFAWISSAGGAADATTTEFYCGKLDLLTTDPDGTDIPTDNYDIVITDADGVDVLAGAGANRDTANTEQVVSSSLGATCYSKLTLAVTNAGAAKAGTIYLHLR